MGSISPKTAYLWCDNKIPHSQKTDLPHARLDLHSTNAVAAKSQYQLLLITSHLVVMTSCIYMHVARHICACARACAPHSPDYFVSFLGSVSWRYALAKEADSGVYALAAVRQHSLWWNVRPAICVELADDVTKFTRKSLLPSLCYCNYLFSSILHITLVVVVVIVVVVVSTEARIMTILQDNGHDLSEKRVTGPIVQ